MDKGYVPETWTKRHWAAVLLLLSAFACIVFFANDKEIGARKWVGSYFGYSVFAAMLIFSQISWTSKRIKGRRRFYDKIDNPKMFGFILIFKYLIPSLCGLLIGLYFTFNV